MITQTTDSSSVRSGSLAAGNYRAYFHNKDYQMEVFEGLNEKTAEIISNALDSAGYYDHTVQQEIND